MAVTKYVAAIHKRDHWGDSWQLVEDINKVVDVPDSDILWADSSDEFMRQLRLKYDIPHQKLSRWHVTCWSGGDGPTSVVITSAYQYNGDDVDELLSLAKSTGFRIIPKAGFADGDIPNMRKKGFRVGNDNGVRYDPEYHARILKNGYLEAVKPVGVPDFRCFWQNVHRMAPNVVVEQYGSCMEDVIRTVQDAVNVCNMVFGTGSYRRLHTFQRIIKKFKENVEANKSKFRIHKRFLKFLLDEAARRKPRKCVKDLVPNRKVVKIDLISK